MSTSSPRAAWRWSLGLGVAFVVLVAFLAALEVVFVREARAARDEVQAHQRALEQYATSTLARDLEETWRQGSERVESALVDPLVDASGAFRVVRGVVQVPPRAGAAEDVVGGLHAQLVRHAVAADNGPFGERVTLVEAVRAALRRGDRAEVSASVRRWLEHRARWVLPPAQEFALTVVVVEALERETTPTPELLRQVLRDGARGSVWGEGLERAVLRSLSSVSSGDAAFLREEVTRLARAGGVDVADFAMRFDAVAPPELPVLAEGLWVVAGEAPCVVRVAGDEVTGVRFDPAMTLRVLTQDMQARGLLEDEDSLAPPFVGAVLANRLAVTVEAPRFATYRRDVERGFWLKTALVVLALVLGAVTLAATFITQRRRQQYVELKSEFVSTVSHELRTPLASLRLMAETLERKVQAGSDVQNWPARIVSEVDSLSFLVENILSFNRLEKGKWAPRKSAWEVRSLEAMLRDDAARAPVEVVVQVALPEVTIQADAQLMQVLFQNLLRNAWKYNERSPVEVRVEGRVEAGQLWVTFSDNGVGIAAEQRERVFDAFFRLREQAGRGGGGSGLGLALCRRVAELHGGAIAVRESSASGTMFELVLPVDGEIG